MSAPKLYTQWKLSEREYQVFIGIVSDLSASEISKSLQLSPKTVATYRDRVRKKTGFKSNVSMAVYYHTHRDEFGEENGKKDDC